MTISQHFTFRLDILFPLAVSSKAQKNYKATFEWKDSELSEMNFSYLIFGKIILTLS